MTIDFTTGVLIEGTGLVGYITTTYDELVRVFGEPDGAGDKTQAEWTIRFADSTLANIYDWKSDGEVEDVTEWNIGGHSARAVTLVKAALRG